MYLRTLDPISRGLKLDTVDDLERSPISYRLRTLDPISRGLKLLQHAEGIRETDLLRTLDPISRGLKQDGTTSVTSPLDPISRGLKHT